MPQNPIYPKKQIRPPIYDYSKGMLNTPNTSETLNIPANPPINKMSTFPDIQPGTFGNMWSGVKNFFGGNQGEGLT